MQRFSRKMRLLHALLLSALPLSCLCQLVREPEEERVMVSDRVKGVKLSCYDTQRRETHLQEAKAREEAAAKAGKETVGDGEGDGEEEAEEDKTGVEWFHWPAGGRESQGERVSDEHIEVDDGKSNLVWDHEEAKPGVVKCQFGSEKYQWKVDPHFKLIPMAKSEYVSEGDDAYLECKLRPSAAITDGELTFSWR